MDKRIPESSVIHRQRQVSRNIDGGSWYQHSQVDKAEYAEIILENERLLGDTATGKWYYFSDIIIVTQVAKYA